MPATEEEILELARRENDPKDRAYLLLLLKINSNLEANTQATKDISSEIQTHRAEFEQHRIEFRKHVTDEAALFNQGRGMWRVTAVVLTVMQVAAFSLASWYVNKQDDESKQLKAISDSVVRNEAKHDEIYKTDAGLLHRIESLEKKVFGP